MFRIPDTLNITKMDDKFDRTYWICNYCAQVRSNIIQHINSSQMRYTTWTPTMLLKLDKIRSVCSVVILGTQALKFILECLCMAPTF